MNAGFHLNVPADKYHADPCAVPSLSAGVAKILLSESPRKAWFSHPRLNPEFRERHDDKFDIGTAAHAVLLEADQSRIMVVQADDWRTKAAKEQRQAARAAGKTALLERHHAAVMAMVQAAQTFIASSEVAELWADADSEVTGICNEGNTWMRCRFDRISKSRRGIADYKSTEDVSPEGFSRQIVRMGYHLQDAFYRRVARNLGVTSPRFVFLAQSVEPPHECSLHGCDPSLAEIADAEVERAIQLWRRCVSTKTWPSYGGRIHYALPTSWMMTQHEMLMAQEAA